MKGSPHKGKMEGLAFLWNVMDRDTRFLLASKVSESRDLSGTVKAFQEAIANAKGQLPDMVRTDAHKSYPVGVKWAFDEVAKKWNMSRAAASARVSTITIIVLKE